MEILIYTGPHGHTATLTTYSPSSHYGIPVLRIEGPGLDDLPDYGPADVLPSGLPAQELVWSWLCCADVSGDSGGWEPVTEAGRDAARAFCSQHPYEPEVSR